MMSWSWDSVVSFIKSAIIASIAIIAPIHTMLIVTSVLIVVDTITGIIAALSKKEKINSRAFGRIITKLFLYNLFIIAAFLVEKFILLDTIQFVRIAVAIIALTELFSVMENIEIATGISFGKIKDILESVRNSPPASTKNKK